MVAPVLELQKVQEPRRNKMEEEKKQQETETKQEIVKDIEKSGVPKEIAKQEEKLDEKAMKKADEKKSEPKKEEKKKSPKKEEKPKEKKSEAMARGLNLHASPKNCAYICKSIKNKKIDNAITYLNKVTKFENPIPFKSGIPHRKGKKVMSGRYPLKASKLFVTLLKGLRGNVIVNGLDLDKTIIYEAMANKASRPMRSGGRAAKRTHVILKAREVAISRETPRKP